MIHIPFGEEKILNIPKIIGKYEYIKVIGYGSFSIVLLVQNKKGENFACKVVSRELLNELNIFNRFEQEVRIMEQFKHPNIASVQEIVYSNDFIFIIMDYYKRGELFSYILNSGYLSEMDIKKILKQLLEAVSYIHSKDISHRDIKPENILLDSDLVVKLADFGLCHETHCNLLLNTPCGSPFYASPEIIENKPYDGKKSDIWSIGIVLFTMATGTLPWINTNQQKLFEEIIKVEINIPKLVSPPIQNLISLMIQKDPKLRPSAKELLNHPWLIEDDFFIFKSLNKIIKQIKLNNNKINSADSAIKYLQSSKKNLIIRPIKNQNEINDDSFIKKIPNLNSKKKTNILIKNYL